MHDRQIRQLFFQHIQPQQLVDLQLRDEIFYYLLHPLVCLRIRCGRVHHRHDLSELKEKTKFDSEFERIVHVRFAHLVDIGDSFQPMPEERRQVIIAVPIYLLEHPPLSETNLLIHTDSLREILFDFR